MKLLLTPIDTWFFRDSTPFDMGAAPQAGVRGVFPPHPSTVAGAIRAALARSNGWDGCGRWNGKLNGVLGDGYDELKRLAFTGPFVVRDSAPLFPMPRHVVVRHDGDGRWIASAMLRPSAGAACDLGTSVQLPEIAGKPSDSIEKAAGASYWVTAAGLQQIVRGRLPAQSEAVHQNELWQEEPRVGIARGRATRTAADGALYSTRHARLSPGVGIGIEVSGVPDDWKLPAGSMVPFGGESRLAACGPGTFEVSLEADEVAGESSGWVVLIALTPALLDPDVMRGCSDLMAGTGTRAVSACADRPLRIGGWDSLRRAPLPLQNALPPGSTLFCDIKDRTLLRRQTTRGLLRLGARQAFGFGLFAVGSMPGGEQST